LADPDPLPDEILRSGLGPGLRRGTSDPGRFPAGGEKTRRFRAGGG
jgi:hypothetical protein